MPFSRGFMLFAQRLPVVPVALRAGLPWGLHTHTLTSSFAANMFWFCFAPWVRLDAVVLQPMQFCEVRPLAPAVHSSYFGWFCSSCWLIPDIQAYAMLASGVHEPRSILSMQFCQGCWLPCGASSSRKHWFIHQSATFRDTQI